jgi:hypothetical protein
MDVDPSHILRHRQVQWRCLRGDTPGCVSASRPAAPAPPRTAYTAFAVVRCPFNPIRKILWNHINVAVIFIIYIL